MFKSMEFMSAWDAHKYAGVDLVVSRLGYTGEDGFEVAVPNTKIEQFIDQLMAIEDNG